jgi:hypothetical protein
VAAASVAGASVAVLGSPKLQADKDKDNTTRIANNFDRLDFMISPIFLPKEFEFDPTMRNINLFHMT